MRLTEETEALEAGLAQVFQVDCEVDRLSRRVITAALFCRQRCIPAGDLVFADHYEVSRDHFTGKPAFAHQPATPNARPSATSPSGSDVDGSYVSPSTATNTSNSSNFDEPERAPLQPSPRTTALNSKNNSRRYIQGLYVPAALHQRHDGTGPPTCFTKCNTAYPGPCVLPALGERHDSTGPVYKFPQFPRSEVEVFGVLSPRKTAACSNLFTGPEPLLKFFPSPVDLAAKITHPLQDKSINIHCLLPNNSTTSLVINFHATVRQLKKMIEQETGLQT